MGIDANILYDVLLTSICSRVTGEKQITSCKVKLYISVQRTNFIIQELYFFLLRIKSLLTAPVKMVSLLYIFKLRVSSFTSGNYVKVLIGTAEKEEKRTPY